MEGPFPCSNPPSTCDTNPNPSTSFSSEAVDSTTFIGIAWNNQPPALGAPFTATPCEAIAESQISQADADRIASNQAINCSNPCATPVFNTAQTATALCADGNPYFFTVPAGVFTAENQVLADRKAFTAAVAALNGKSLCLGAVAPASVCLGEFYFGIISILSTDTPISTELVQGELPEGLSFTFESTRVVIQGTPISFGAAQFTLRSTSASGIFSLRQYTVVVTGIVTDSTLADGSTGAAYSAQLQAILVSGETPNWTVTAGALPDGLSLNADTGEISGTPTTAEASTFTASVTTLSGTCSKEFSLNVASSGGVACICATGDTINTIDGGPDGPLSGTRTASVRRLVCVDTDDGLVAFVDTATNTVVNTISLATGYADGNRFKQVAFATSTNNFFFVTPDFSAMTVTDIDGNVVGSIVAPGGYNFGTGTWVYSPEADKLYTFLNNVGTGTQHILEFDPHTFANTRDVDTTTAGYRGIGYYPNNVVLYGSSMDNYPTSTLTLDKTSGAFNARGHMDYDPASNRIFVGESFTDAIVAFNCVDFSRGTTFTPSIDNGPYEFVSFNPVMQVIICYNFSMEIVVIDPAADVIICQANNLDPSGSGGGMVIDWSSGKVFLLDEDFVHNPLDIFASCPNNICNNGIGTLLDNTYAIDGYFDGLIDNSASDPSAFPNWDGTFIFFFGDGNPFDGSTGWDNGGTAHHFAIQNKKACTATLSFFGCDGDGNPQWHLAVSDIDDQNLWEGDKLGGATPEGDYTFSDGTAGGPATLTIVRLGSGAVAESGNLFCSS